MMTRHSLQTLAARGFRAARQGCGFLLVFGALAAQVRADFTAPSVPEVDPGAAASAMTLFVGGLLMLSDRFRQK